ncbi:hypothetical protein COW36_04135 [bacterium (Candidatus Blackallbacteria) CG17_big_fil_post_rev_8_21_14_2_50_48_46]|uniref:Uncharacterized protein n=1 Tax=bacterium (Candidatus Blackallbacteria) CG17_big_fil_post_rev_8_21_14_2_50_48_46 TaxID=2014261 RepID=A0A2M7G8S2_9BACT|nr:MAG: hypothetical protein COW64_04810 [bacterium (Candidatus Blackallbacteria) CG18_big_fil_WC_8_21_14_2_50_49_26]PIW18487.1 MAG: hypothetical protein COW36_04135 [bacterium (Candidatus Blackallbacteria) CG17_big_fil_post_rev_8_21_14_2_50_48_46]PIW46528.1 MAG: hypothetical protein COW20_16545 [bacterium (Candidatus Blackallbacteria) CG13_big_fil_rev_8_21_14_2_50_49_14]
MMMEGLPGMPQPADPAAVDKFLSEFSQKCVEFGYYCDQYMRNEIGIGDITRHLSEATADAEMQFAEYSFSMSMEQLQRYGVIQNSLDTMTFKLFETEIERNKEVVLEALKHGEYFIIGLTYNSIKSSVYMMNSKKKIKTEQEQMLAELEREQEATQGMVKVLKAIESVIKVENVAQVDFAKIQKALEIYVNYFRNAEHVHTKPASDERVFILFGEHVDFLAENNFAGDKTNAAMHIGKCTGILQLLAHTDEQKMRLDIWRQVVNS